ncbi:IclR family transcriptional regulator [Desulfatitalea alkaliphila]|uniref:IclR family transcriptional regulator n=1 Tax=Desulfatitalea alkaliphila TaxID=2929485 RepID=A0AA41UJS7_9BACT|nr:IclR family transcriptional regulator [Desulfatitalea alkaliphila]MCJ8501539.1 IclR family transcriptional regulator [Desulfatitalea alkaliphila]
MLVNLSAKTTRESGGKQAGVQSIRRALAVIQVVADHNRSGVGLSKIAGEVGLTPSTTHRIAAVLVDEGILSHNGATKLYHLGIGLYLLGSSARQYQVRDIYRDTLEKIAEQTGDTVFLIMQSGYDALCVDRVVGNTPIQILSLNIGERRPLGVGAGSLAILASLPGDQRERIMRHNRRRYAAYPGYSPDDLARMIKMYREQGFVVNTVTPYTIGVGTCVHDEEGTLIGAVSVSGIVSQMDRKRQKQIAALIKSAIQ